MSIEDDLIRHQIYLQRRGAGIYNSIIPELKEMRDKITARIANATPNELLRIKGMLKDLNSIIDGSFDKIQPSLFKDFEELAVYEGEHALKMLDANTAAAVTIGAGVNDAALIAMVGKSKMYVGNDKGATIDDLISTFSDRYKKDIKSEIELGLLAGDTTDDIVKRIQSLSNGRTREQAKAMVLTIANHVGHQARSEVWEPYSDLFDGEEFNATLDGRTTLQCASLDLKVFPIGKGPQPPLHYRCRSIRVIKVKEQYSLGIDTTRSSMNGPVSSKLTYSGWLKGQSKEVQNEVLGVERAKLFRSGKITLDRFVDDKGKMYSLNQLKKADVIGTVKKHNIFDTKDILGYSDVELKDMVNKRIDRTPIIMNNPITKSIRAWSEDEYTEVRKAFQGIDNSADVSTVSGLKDLFKYDGNYKGDIYRGLSIPDRETYSFFDSLKELDDITDIAPSSWSSVKDVAHEFANVNNIDTKSFVLKLESKGTSAYDVSSISTFMDEGEIILKPSTKIRVKAIEFIDIEDEKIKQIILEEY